MADAAFLASKTLAALILPPAGPLLAALLAMLIAALARTRFLDRKSTRLNSSHIQKSRMPSSA